MGLDPKAFEQLNYGIYAITTWDRGKPTGCIASSVMQLASSPAMFAVSINTNNYTNTCIKQCKHFAVNILSEEQAMSVVETLGFSSAKRVKKFTNIPQALRNRLPVMDNCLSYISCKVTEVVELGNNTLFIGEAIGSEVLDASAQPLSYMRYRDELQGKLSENAPNAVTEA